MTKLSRWALSVCAGLSLTQGCYETGGRGDPDAGAPALDAARGDVHTAPGGLPEGCQLAWLRTIPVNPVGIGVVTGVGVDRDENVLVSFSNTNEFTLDGVRYPAGEYLMGLDRENGLQLRPSARAVVVTSSQGRILGATTDASGTHLAELDGRTGEVLHDFGLFIVDRFTDVHAAFVGETLVWSMQVQGSFAFPGSAFRRFSSETHVVFTIAARWRGVAELESTQLLFSPGPDGVLVSGSPGRLCFNSVCRDVLSTRFLIHEDGSITSVPEGQVDRDMFTSQIQALEDGSLMTLGSGLRAWDRSGAPVWTQSPPDHFNLRRMAVDERQGRVVTMTRIEDLPTAMLGALRLDVGASTQELFIEFSLTYGTPLRWWHIENPDGAGRSGASRLVMGGSGRSYVSGIADPVVDVCGVRVVDGVFVAAFD